MIYTIEQIKEKCRKVFEKQDFVKEAYLFQHIKVQIQIESALLYSNSFIATTLYNSTPPFLNHTFNQHNYSIIPPCNSAIVHLISFLL